MYARAIPSHILVALLLLALPGAAAVDAPTSVARGRMVEENERSPVAGVTIQVLGTRPGAVPDSAGEFRVDHGPGDWDLGEIEPGARIPLETLETGVRSMGVVRGRIVARADHSPVAWANVVVLGTRRGDIADSLGTFRIDRVPPGDYTLRVRLIGTEAVSRAIHVESADCDLGDIELATRTPAERVTIGSRAAVRADELEASIRPARRWFAVGDTPAFKVRIKNRGARATVLVQSVDASDRWASPRVQIEITGPDGGYVVPGMACCGNNNGVRSDDFVAVAPGAEFDPYASGWIGANITHGRFARPGLYTATFRYSTIDFDPKTWMGGPCGNCDLSPAIRGLLEEVPPVALTAKVTFRVDP